MQRPRVTSMRMSRAWAMAPLFALLLATGCGAAETPDAATTAEDETPAGTTATVAFPVEVVDASGETVEIAERPERIACLHHECRQLLAALGVDPSRIWVPGPLSDVDDFLHATQSYWGDEADQVNVFDMEFQSVEDLLAAEPDLIVDVGDTPDFVAASSEIAPHLATHRGYEDPPLARVPETLRNLDLAINGSTERAEEILATWDETLDELLSAIPDVEEPPSLMVFLYFGEEYYSLFRQGGPCQQLEEWGIGVCPFDAPAGVDPYGDFVAAEAVVAADPDWIYVVTSPTTEPPVSEKSDAVWTQLTAVKEGRVIVDNGDGFSQFGSLQSTEYSLRKFLSTVYAEESGIADPGPFDEFVPAVMPDA